MAAIKIDLGPVEALLQQILVTVTSQLPVLNLIFAKPVAVENRPYEIANAVQGIQALAEDGTVGFAALEALMVASFNTLVTDIGTTAQSGVQPSWWNTAPSWWVAPTTPPTPPTANANASAVWGFPTGFPSSTALGALSEIRYKAVQEDIASVAFPAEQAEPWWISGPFYDHRYTPDPRGNAPTVDFTTILATDATANAWVRRQYPTGQWELPARGICVWQGSDNFDYSLPWLTQPEFDRIKAELFPAAIVGAPVWPGIAGVTLGAPVALSPTCVVTGPMHGVIIDITSAAPRQVYQVFGGMQGYRFVGGLQFVDDHGEAERIQSIGMAHEVIVCKSMAEAASCSIRTDSAVTGTATPFVIT